MQADAGAGSIVIRKTTGSVHCETGGGTIELGEIPGEVQGDAEHGAEIDHEEIEFQTFEFAPMQKVITRSVSPAKFFATLA